jgi:hypothetical protein
MAGEPEEISRIITANMGLETLILLRKQMNGIASVHEDFENDIYSTLSEARAALFKYDTLNIVFPADSCYPRELTEGFIRFCNDHGFLYNITNGFCRSAVMKQGEVYITISDEDLAITIQCAETADLEIGKDVGLISFNETPLKEVLLDGITTISTDFKKMGRLAAMQIVNHSNENIAVPCQLTLRSSL